MLNAIHHQGFVDHNGNLSALPRHGPGSVNVLTWLVAVPNNGVARFLARKSHK